MRRCRWRGHSGACARGKVKDHPAARSRDAVSLGFETLGGVIDRANPAPNTTIRLAGGKLIRRLRIDTSGLEIPSCRASGSSRRTTCRSARSSWTAFHQLREGRRQIEVTFDIRCERILNVSARRIRPRPKVTEERSPSRSHGLTKEEAERGGSGPPKIHAVKKKRPQAAGRSGEARKPSGRPSCTRPKRRFATTATS